MSYSQGCYSGSADRTRTCLFGYFKDCHPNYTTIVELCWSLSSFAGWTWSVDELGGTWFSDPRISAPSEETLCESPIALSPSKSFWGTKCRSQKHRWQNVNTPAYPAKGTTLGGGLLVSRRQWSVIVLVRGVPSLVGWLGPIATLLPWHTIVVTSTQASDKSPVTKRDHRNPGCLCKENMPTSFKKCKTHRRTLRTHTHTQHNTPHSIEQVKGGSLKYFDICSGDLCNAAIKDVTQRISLWLGVTVMTKYGISKPAYTTQHGPRGPGEPHAL